MLFYSSVDILPATNADDASRRPGDPATPVEPPHAHGSRSALAMPGAGTGGSGETISIAGGQASSK
jgi:hypothetical protein